VDSSDAAVDPSEAAAAPSEAAAAPSEAAAAPSPPGSPNCPTSMNPNARLCCRANQCGAATAKRRNAKRQTAVPLAAAVAKSSGSEYAPCKSAPTPYRVSSALFAGIFNPKHSVCRFVNPNTLCGGLLTLIRCGGLLTLTRSGGLLTLRGCVQVC
jgi:hypothetical protein